MNKIQYIIVGLLTIILSATSFAGTTVNSAEVEKVKTEKTGQAEDYEYEESKE